MMAQGALWWAAGLSACVTVAAVVAEWLRSRRRNLDSVGWVPWNGIQILGLFAAMMFVVVAIKTA